MRGLPTEDALSDEPEASSDTPNDLLADLNRSALSGTSGGPNRPDANHAASTQSNPAWIPSPTSSSSALASNPGRQSVFMGYSRHASNSRVDTISSFDQPEGSAASPLTPTNIQQSNLFQNPNRSIFTSGRPTSSISPSTAHASMSAPSPGRRRPLAALSHPRASAPRRPTVQIMQPPESPRIGLATTGGVEKDADDPTTASEGPSNSRRSRLVPMALQQIFSEPTDSPPVSRHDSYLRTLSGTHYTKVRPFDASPLAPHVYGQGLLNGKFSDITVHAFGTSYHLHRLLLDRAPFFSTAFSGPWMESSSKEMTLDHTDVDSNITQAAFELALKRIYGCQDPDEEDQEAIGIFAVGNWLEMDDLLESSIASILKQMTPPKLSSYIQFVTGNYYGRAGDRILAACKAMLCRDGWQMPIRYWDGIPGDIVRETVGNDGFYVAGEWDRWVLAKRLLNRRLRQVAWQSGLVDDLGKIKKAPRSLSNMAVRFDTVFRQSSPVMTGKGDAEQTDPWLALYTHPDVAQLLVLVDEGIHYVHLSFEQLQRIRDQKDACGLALLPEKVISASLWMQLELRQKVVNAGESELELGLTKKVEDVDAALEQASKVLGLSEQAALNDNDKVMVSSDEEQDSRPAGVSATAAGKQPEVDNHSELEAETDGFSDSWDGNGKPRKYWIPTSDATFPVGEGLENHDAKPVRASRSTRKTANRFSASVPIEDVHWASDFASLANAANDNHVHGDHIQRPPSGPQHLSSSAPESPTIATVPSPQITYTNLPPFRFSVEFPAARMLKEGKRFYSPTLWYAGSLYNVYVQKKDTPKGLQLGVYLHRERQSENNDVLLASYNAGHSVDERIGRLERQMEARYRADHRAAATRDGDTDSTLINPGADLDTISGTLSRPSRRQRPEPSYKNGSNLSLPLTSFAPYDAEHDSALGDEYRGSESDTDDTADEPYASSSLLASGRAARTKVPALPPYVDARPTIKTYFKIYTPSKGGRVLTVYESRPDRFNFSQSWGWKSGSLDLDGDAAEDAKEGRDKKLRFMVVVGTV